MTSGERLRKALSHEEPDCIPFDIGGTETSGISIVALEQWLNYKGIPYKPVEVFSLETQIGKGGGKGFAKFWCVDTRCLRTDPPSGWKLDIRENQDYKYLESEWEIIWRMPKRNGFYYDLHKSLLSSFSTVEEIKKFSWPDPYDLIR